MKKVRLFAVAAAMGMFASSVSAATQTGPVVTKTSGSFAWGEFASVMKVDMGDKVVAPQVTVTATTEGRTTDIDYATYKTSTGLTKTSTCYVGFTNTVGKDTNIDGLNDTPLYVIKNNITNPGTNPSGDLTYFSNVDEAVEYWASAGEQLFGAKILAPGQGEIDEVYTLSGSTQTFEDLEDVFDYLVEKEIVSVEISPVTELISKVVLDETTFYEPLPTGYDDTTRPLGTAKLVVEADQVTRERDEVAVKKAIADLFVSRTTSTAGTSFTTLQGYSSSGKALAIEYTTTTATASSVLSDYYYPTSVTKGVADNLSGKIVAADVKNYGAALVVEYNTKYDVYEPRFDMTTILNAVIKAAQAETDSYNSWRSKIAAATTSTYADSDAVIAALAADSSAAAAYIKGQITANDTLTKAQGEVAALSATYTQTLEANAVKGYYSALPASGASGVNQATFKLIFAGNQDTNALYDNAANPVDWTVNNSSAGTTLLKLFEYAGLDYQPAKTSVKDTFIQTGKMSILEYDADKNEDDDFVVLSYAKKAAATVGKYTTITAESFNIADMAWESFEVTSTAQGTEAKTATSWEADFADASITVPAASTGVMFTDHNGNDIHFEDYAELFGDGNKKFETKELGLLVEVQNVPENDTDYIVLNFPSSTSVVKPVSQSRTKGTAQYVSSVTGEEIMVHFVELKDSGKSKDTHWYPAVETMADAKEFLRIVLGIHTPSDANANAVNATKYLANLTYKNYQTITYLDGTTNPYYLPKNTLADSSAVQCTYSTNKGSDVKTEAASVSFDASAVDTTKAGVYTATLTAKAGETTETKDVTVVVAPKYSRTWDNKGRVSTLKAYWLSGNLYAEYKYTYNADNTITVVSTFYREDGVTVADTATTTK